MDEPNIKNYLEYDMVAAQFGEDTARSLAAAISIAVHGCVGSISAVSHNLGEFHMVVARAIFGHLSHESDLIERAAAIMEEDGASIDERGIVSSEAWADAMAKAKQEYQEFLMEQVAAQMAEDTGEEDRTPAWPPVTRH